MAKLTELDKKILANAIDRKQYDFIFDYINCEIIKSELQAQITGMQQMQELLNKQLETK